MPIQILRQPDKRVRKKPIQAEQASLFPTPNLCLPNGKGFDNTSSVGCRRHLPLKGKARCADFSAQIDATGGTGKPVSLLQQCRRLPHGFESATPQSLLTQCQLPLHRGANGLRCTNIAPHSRYAAVFLLCRHLPVGQPQLPYRWRLNAPLKKRIRRCVNAPLKKRT